MFSMCALMMNLLPVPAHLRARRPPRKVASFCLTHKRGDGQHEVSGPDREDMRYRKCGISRRAEGNSPDERRGKKPISASSISLQMPQKGFTVSPSNPMNE